LNRLVAGVDLLEQASVWRAFIPDMELVELQLEKGTQQEQVAQLPGQVQQGGVRAGRGLRQVSFVGL
jgi:hypothetical protein